MRTVGEAMIAPPPVVAPATTMQETSRAMLRLDTHSAVIVDEGRVCGVTSADGIARALAEGYDAAETSIGVIAEREPPVVRADDTLVDARQRLVAEGRRVAAVVDGNGAPVGLLEAEF